MGLLETTMLDALRTLLLAGVGAIDLTDEKMRSIIDELIRRGELAADDARELTILWADGVENRRDAIADRVRKAVDEALARQNVASHASVADLQARIEILEQVVARLAEPTVES
jgi:polyhydroxyalkanoate synthesis regulator phasin